MLRVIHPAAATAAFLTLALPLTPLAAQDMPRQSMPPQPGFTLQAVEGGVLKLDTRSGALSFCSAKAGSWVCEAVPEDRRALEDEIARLQARIAGLEKGGATAPRGGVPDIMGTPVPAQPSPPQPSPPLAGQTPPSEGGTAPGTEEPNADAERRLDRAIDMAEHVFRRFFDMVERLRREETAPHQQGL